MNIIIAGAGKVGFNLAKTLSIGHNVTIIDINSEALHRIQESLDILPLRGDVENLKTYQNFIGQKINLFIAVTNSDNVNLLATFIADTVLDIERKFVRLQKEFFTDSLIKDRLSIDEMIFPLNLASRTVISLLDYPRANNVKSFKYTNHKLISVRISADYELSSESLKGVQVVGIERDKKFFIPKLDEALRFNDLVYIFGIHEDIRSLCLKLESSSHAEIKKCVVFGGGDLGISVAKELLNTKLDVKLIEKDLDLCQKADEELEGRASIINLKYGTTDIFEEEDLENADLFIAATSSDEYNIIKCLEAKEKGIVKVLAINNEMEYYSLMHSLGIIVVRGAKMSAYNTIIEQISSSGIVIQKSFCGASATVLMRKVFAGSKLINSKIKPINIENANLYYMRNEEMNSFVDKITLQEGDLVIAFCTTKVGPKIKEWIYGL